MSSRRCGYRAADQSAARHGRREARPRKSLRPSPGNDFRNLGIRLPVLVFGDMHFSYARLLSLGAALMAWSRSLHEAHIYGHRDPRHRAGLPDHVADGLRYQPHVPHPSAPGARSPARRPPMVP
jgi:hypothetical protein